MENETQPLKKCSACGKEFQTQKALTQHMRCTHGPGKICPHCSKRFASIQMLRKHIAIFHQTDETTRVKCSACGKEFQHQAAHRQHIEREHGGYNQEQIAGPSSTSRAEDPQQEVDYDGWEDEAEVWYSSPPPSPDDDTMDMQDSSDRETHSTPSVSASPASSAGQSLDEGRRGSSSAEDEAEELMSVDSREAEQGEQVDLDMSYDPDDLPITWIPIQHYELERVAERRSRIMQSGVLDYRLTFHDVQHGLSLPEASARIFSVLDSALGRLREQAPQRAHARISIQAPSLHSAINTRFEGIQNLTAKRLTDIIVRKINSDESFELNDCKLNFLYTRTPVGGAMPRYGLTCKNRRIASIKKYNESRRGILDVCKNAADQRCLARVIVAARFYAEFGEKLGSMKAGHEKGPSFLMKQWARMRQGYPFGYQYQQAMRLIVEAKTGPFGPYSLEDAVKFQEVLPSYRLVIFDVQGTIVWSGPPLVVQQNDPNVVKEQPKNLYILYHAQESHFYMVTKPANLIGRRRFCPYCLLGYDSRRKEHQCGHSGCDQCLQTGCGGGNREEAADSGYEKYCSDCNRTWKSASKNSDSPQYGCCNFSPQIASSSICKKIAPSS